MINNDRTCFASSFWKEIKDLGSLELRFDSKTSKYKNIMFKIDRLDAFIKRLVEQIPFSSKEIRFSKDQKNELESMQRLQEICREKQLVYKRHTTNRDTIDSFINEKKIQMKFLNFNSFPQNNYNIKLCKSSGSLNGKYLKRSYDEGDFDFLIIEIGGIRTEIDGIIIEDPNKYKGNFLILPSEALKNMGYFTSSDGTNGKITFSFYPPGKNQWYESYWNNFNLLRK